jgi:hypothetical protein
MKLSTLAQTGSAVRFSSAYQSAFEVQMTGISVSLARYGFFVV